MLTADEIVRIKEHLFQNHQAYLAASEHIVATCLRFKVQYPQIVRVIFRREPPIKTLESVVTKIQLVRETEGNPNYSIEDLNDIIALTVLCPYETDVKEFIAWMRGVFEVHTPEEKALRRYATGHVARHYVISAKSDATTFHFATLRCELQVKTILQEAFDAKSHDLAYKPKQLKVSTEVAEQFALLSTALQALDGQSEFLKNLILRDKKELSYRRKACLLLYFEQTEVKEAVKLLRLDVNNLPSLTQLAGCLRRHIDQHGVTRELCKVAALCAIKCNSDYLRFEALQYADRFVNEGANQARRYLVRGSLKWLIGRSEAAILDVRTAIEKGAGQSEDTTVVSQSKNNFVYFVSDWKAFENNERADFNQVAKAYVQEFEGALATLDSQLTDTVGLYLIAFGVTEEEVEQGRAYLNNARKRRQADATYPSFFRLHDYIALRKLLDLSTANVLHDQA